MLSNRDVAGKLYELANYMDIDGQNPFRVNAYRRAARTVETLKQPLQSLNVPLTSLDGIGKGTAQAIEETLIRGEPELLTQYREKLPDTLMELLRIPGLGPKSVKVLYQKLGVQTVADLEQALRQNKVQTLPGFGVATESKLLEAVKRYGERPERLLLGQALPLAERIVQHISELSDVEHASVAGSIRRMKETVKDIDIVVATNSTDKVIADITALPFISEVIQRGPTKVTVLVQDDWEIQVDIRLVTPEQFATALHHFTGSPEHNVRIRQLAKQKGWKVSEYGIETETGDVRTFPDEASFFQEFGLPYIPPELREGQEETVFDLRTGIPNLVTLDHMRGDLHVHSQWSDGHHTIRDMAERARTLGYEYIAITDHSRSLRVAGGLSIEDLYKQQEEIETVRREVTGITVLSGVEMDILSDGQLDYPDDVLKSLDFVIGSIHSSFSQDEQTMTKRLLNAIEHPHVHMIAHPSGRLLNRREAYRVAWDEVFRRAAETGTILEINANPQRLDLWDELLRVAVFEYGVTIAINSDAHHVDGFSVMRYGVGMARRGWLTPEHVANTWPLEKLRRFTRRKGSL